MKMEIQQSCALTTLPPASPLQRRPVCGKEGNVGYHPTHRRLESYNMQVQKYRKTHLQIQKKIRVIQHANTERQKSTF